jgi:magnesium transporter
MSEVTTAIFRDGAVVGRVGLEASKPHIGNSEFVWIEVTDPIDSDLEVLKERFRLDSLAVTDSMGPRQAAKLDLYDGQIFVVLPVAHLESDEIKYAAIDAFVSRHHIITVHRGADTDYISARDRLQNGPKSTHLGPDFILHAVMDFVVTSYFPVVQMVEDEVLAMEQRLLDSFLDRVEITRLFQLRREVIHFLHVLSGMSDLCGKIANLEIPCISVGVKPYFRDVHDRLARLGAIVSGLADVIQAVFAASSLLEQQRQGIITRQLAAWAAILGVVTATAGIYGMNFVNMPELHSAYGYPTAVASMFAMCLALYLRFKKLGWL